MYAFPYCSGLHQNAYKTVVTQKERQRPEGPATFSARLAMSRDKLKGVADETERSAAKIEVAGGK